MSAYNHQINNALEVIATLGIGAGIVATGALFVKDIYDYDRITGTLGKKSCSYRMTGRFT